MFGIQMVGVCSVFKWYGFWMVLDKMAAICLDFKWSGPFEIQTMVSLDHFILTTQTHTLCRGALRFTTQIFPLLNFYIKQPRLERPFWMVRFSNGGSKTEPFENRTLKRSVFEWIWNANVRYSSPHVFRTSSGDIGIISSQLSRLSADRGLIKKIPGGTH